MPPANDNFASSTGLSGPSGSITGTNIGATTEASESGHYFYNYSPVYPVANHVVGPFATVWYNWYCATSGYYYFTTRDLTGAMLTDFKSSIQVLNSVNGAVGYGSGAGYVIDQHAGDGGGLDNGATIVFYASAGNIYHFQIDGRSASDVGSFTLAWGPSAFPAVRLGTCGGTVDFVPAEICYGAMQITDITADGYYSFGNFVARAGNYAVRLVGGNPISTNLGPIGTISTFPSGNVVDGDFGSFTRWTDYGQGSGSSYASGTYVAGYCQAAKAITSVPAFAPDGTNGTYWNTAVGNGTVIPFGYSPAGNYVSGDNPGYTSGPLVSTYPVCNTACPPHDPSQGTTSFWVRREDYGLPPTFCQETVIPHHGANVESYPVDSGQGIGITIFGNGMGTNTAQNATYQLIYYPLTLANLSVNAVVITDSTGHITSPDGLNWTISFTIHNNAPTAWDRTTVELLATGGVSSPSAAQVMTLAASADTNTGTATGALFSFQATPSSGLVTATIRISRNGVVVGTIDCPLYPIITACVPVASQNLFENNCSGTKYWVFKYGMQVFWLPNNLNIFGDPAYTRPFWSISTHNILCTNASIVGGSPALTQGAGPATCTVISSLEIDEEDKPGAFPSTSCTGAYTFAVAAASTPTNFTLQVTFRMQVGASAFVNLPTVTIPLTCNAA